ncbi:MAG: dolichol-phosphate mannosyltransferase [Mariniblastus sp.]|jgi:dolichol-phosphate mannosyltransferase
MTQNSTDVLDELAVVELTSRSDNAPTSGVDPTGRQQLSNCSARIWVMMPAYNEEAVIATLIEKIYVASQKTDYQLEIVIVDDASKDNTAQVVSQLSFNGPINLLQHKRNQGLAGAMRSGFKYVLENGHVGDVIVTLDADDTQPPASIPKMLTMIEEGFDVVIASRYQNGSRTIGVPWNRLAMTWFAKWLFKIITPIPGVWDYTCGFRAYRFAALKQSADFHGEQFVSEAGFSCMVDFLLKMRRFNFVMGEVPMLLRYDQKEGPSKMKVATTAGQTLKLLVKRRLRG